MIGLYWKVIGWNLLVSSCWRSGSSAVIGHRLRARRLQRWRRPRNYFFVSQQLPVLIGIGVGYVALVLVM